VYPLGAENIAKRYQMFANERTISGDAFSSLRCVPVCLALRLAVYSFSVLVFGDQQVKSKLHIS
jgi:hypothetical protein